MSLRERVIRAGSAWCEHCNGYGSSLKDSGDRCTRCGGTGLVMVADRRPSRRMAIRNPD